jgi:hypothetical protein
VQHELEDVQTVDERADLEARRVVVRGAASIQIEPLLVVERRRPKTSAESTGPHLAIATGRLPRSRRPPRVPRPGRIAPHSPQWYS